MVTTSTTTSDLNHSNQETDKLSGELLSGPDLMFYESIKSQLDMLKRDPSEESIAKILAYSRIK